MKFIFMINLFYRIILYKYSCGNIHLVQTVKIISNIKNKNHAKKQ